MQDYFSYINRILDFRFQLAVLIVMCGLLLLGHYQIVVFNETLRYMILFFATSSAIAVVYLVIDKIVLTTKSLFELQLQRRRKRKEKEEYESGLERLVFQLDIFEVSVLMKLRSVNSVRIKKSPQVSSLREKRVVDVVSMGSVTCVVKVDEPTRAVLDIVFWPEIDKVIYSASLRFFRGLDIGELGHFRVFLEKSLYVFRLPDRRGGYPTSYHVFNKYRESSVFSDGHSGRAFRMMECARQALREVFEERIPPNGC